MKKNHRCRPRPTGKLVKCLSTLTQVLNQHNNYFADKTRVARKETKIDREQFYEGVFYKLAEDGFHLDNVAVLRLKHVQYLVDTWINEDLATSTINKYLSRLRIFCSWIDKNGMLNKLDLSHVPPQKLYRPNSIQCKDWSKTDEFVPLVSNVIGSDKVVGGQLLLMYAFGLRVHEAMELKPHLADHDSLLGVETRIKGGRIRVVKIEYPVQRHVLDFAKSLVPLTHKSFSTIPKNRTLNGWQNHFYFVLSKHGISKKMGRKAQGLISSYRNGEAPTDKLIPLLVSLTNAEPNRDNLSS